ncbi:MAG: acyl-CoA thioesterase [Phycisphaerales bacterium]|jgi:acyl-CoA thioesterase YciA|nr:acyl-CoA thioesterase [Phycisphaerales bacterium]
MDEDYTTALRIMMMPRDTNHAGTIFGGVILSHIDQAGYVEARQHGNNRWVTVAIDRVEFHAPVFVGDIVAFMTKTARVGRTSVTVDVQVIAERRMSDEKIHVTTAHMVMVSVDEEGRPTPHQQGGDAS